MENPAASQLIARLQSDMRQALKGRRPAEVSALKSLLARISNAAAIGDDMVTAALESGKTEAAEKRSS